MHPVLLIGLVFLSAMVLTGLATRYAHWRGMIDEPGDRHSHTQPTPRGGGIGIVLSLCLALAWIPELRAAPWLTAILPGMLVLSALGWWDDHASLSVRIRFLVQLVVSLAVLGLVFGENVMHNPGWTLLCLLALVWMTNLFNFMDGSNGLAGAQGVFAGSVLAGLFCASGNMNLAAASAVIAAACLGFLPWNLGKARVFMGDTGSLALGFGFGSLLIAGVSNGDFSLPVASLVMLLFVTDATLTLMARVLRGEQWYNPHRQHVYQRLIASGWTHGRVLILYQSINLLLLLPGILLAVRYPDMAWAVTLVLVLIFGTGWYLMTRKTGVLV